MANDRLTGEGESSVQSADTLPSNLPAREPPLVPWERRAQLGAFRAFWTTVFLICRRPASLDRYMEAEVYPTSAKRFHNAATCLATVTWPLTVLVLLYTREGGPGHGGMEIESRVRLAGFIAFMVFVFTGVFVECATRAVAWFFCSGRLDTARRERAIALSYYTCAPLSLTPAVPMVLGLLLWILPEAYLAVIPYGAVVLLVLFSVVWYRTVVSAAHSVTGRRSKRTIMVALALPAVWVGLSALIVLVPAFALMWVLMLASLL